MNIPLTQEVTGPDLQLLEDFPLVESDKENMDSAWHRAAIALLIESVLYHLRDRTDFYVGGNMFLYFNLQQARNRDFRGPDFFFVKDSQLHPVRKYWAVWLEGGRYPDVIIELLSPTTAEEDRTTKKVIYERRFHTYEYFLYDPDTHQLEGWRLGKRLRYEAIQPNDRGWFWSEELELWVGTWQGEYLRSEDTWLRFYDAQGRLVLNKDERATELAESERQRAEAERQRAEAERQRAEAERQRAESERQRADGERQRADSERQRAEATEAELARLRALLGQHDISPEPPGDSSS